MIIFKHLLRNIPIQIKKNIKCKEATTHRILKIHTHILIEYYINFVLSSFAFNIFFKLFIMLITYIFSSN